MMYNLEEAHLKGVHKLTIELLSKVKTLSNAELYEEILDSFRKNMLVYL